MNDGTHNPALYRQLSEPFAGADAANDAIAAFFADVRAAREKHRIADVQVVVSVAIDYGEHQGQAVTSHGLGDSLRAESMLAWALGKEQTERRASIARLLAGRGSERADANPR